MTRIGYNQSILAFVVSIGLISSAATAEEWTCSQYGSVDVGSYGTEIVVDQEKLNRKGRLNIGSDNSASFTTKDHKLKLEILELRQHGPFRKLRGSYDWMSGSDNHVAASLMVEFVGDKNDFDGKLRTFFSTGPLRYAKISFWECELF